MLIRTIQEYFQQAMAQYPVITIMGPRQSGKTTLVQNTCPRKAYYNLEEPDIRERIIADPRSFINAHSVDGAVLDEIQRAPLLLSYIQADVDKNKSAGRFILTGSHQFNLHEAVSQSLAGRTAILDLLPLSISELNAYNIDLSLDEWLLKGFYPAIYDKKLNPTECYRNYVRTYVERDVRQIINIQELTSFQRFLRLVAGRVGSLVSVESLANDVGMAHNTIKKWLSVLEASYLLHKLPPYYENFGKRLIKSPKIYFTDVGIVSYLLGIETTQELQRDRLRGGLFENLVIMELLKELYNHGKETNLFFFRDHHGNEVDLIIKQHDQLIPIEIKSTTTFDRALLKNIYKFRELATGRVKQGFLIYAGEQEMVIDNIQVLNYHNAINTLNQQLPS